MGGVAPRVVLYYLAVDGVAEVPVHVDSHVVADPDKQVDKVTPLVLKVTS